MDKKKNYDLSNVGGQPKDWMDGDNSDAGWLGDLKMAGLFIGLMVLFLASVFLFFYGLL